MKIYDIMARVLDDTFFPCTRYSIIKHMTDALTTEGIGDVSEWKHRAEVAERALRNMASNYWGVECRCLGAYDWEECEKCKDKYILAYENEAVDCLVKVHLEQAEKELKEERKDD